jgi:SAM-dependent methyltransferase
MHPSAYSNGKLFFDTYLQYFESDPVVIEIGSQNVNGSLRDHCKSKNYFGLDFAVGHGVDLVLTDPYHYPLDDNSVDLVVTSSCFEHSEMFWLSFLEGIRILKPTGLLYLNAPSSGHVHRYPVDCWRFYPDSGQALVTWAKKNNIPAMLLESYIDPSNTWKDFITVFIKNSEFASRYPNRMSQGRSDILELVCN